MDEKTNKSQNLTLLDPEVSIDIDQMYNRSESSIDHLTSDLIESLLTEFSDIFSKHKYDIGEIQIEEAQINLESDIPISSRPYRCSEHDQKIIDEQIKQLLKHNIIRYSNSPYSAPITLVNKKDEGEKSYGQQ